MKKPLVAESDFGWSPDEETEAVPLTQEYAWFWKKGQRLPHVISDNVYDVIRHQVKVSTFLYLQSDPGEMLLVTEVPNLRRPFRRGERADRDGLVPGELPVALRAGAGSGG